ncbi:hypothetical protein HO173_003213 [Letharia columbiana]|uniref:Uncharacterized protein n=1 Tax=Letharia columbiana TaxID=112416 RepID=A0A8H6L7L1_9LECA|nr:uncharacterized protein HO173_003213 [Letharia columbiana]KAF6238707.1 hypothetical protein HO173_003213 [Letharia columbiana]
MCIMSPQTLMYDGGNYEPTPDPAKKDAETSNNSRACKVKLMFEGETSLIRDFSF